MSGLFSFTLYIWSMFPCFICSSYWLWLHYLHLIISCLLTKAYLPVLGFSALVKHLHKQSKLLHHHQHNCCFVVVRLTVPHNCLVTEGLKVRHLLCIYTHFSSPKFLSSLYTLLKCSDILICHLDIIRKVTSTDINVFHTYKCGCLHSCLCIMLSLLVIKTVNPYIAWIIDIWAPTDHISQRVRHSTIVPSFIRIKLNWKYLGNTQP